jgi:hypothetical protein
MHPTLAIGINRLLVTVVAIGIKQTLGTVLTAAQHQLSYVVSFLHRTATFQRVQAKIQNKRAQIKSDKWMVTKLMKLYNPVQVT